MTIREGLTYDDVLLSPVYSTIQHRDEQNIDLRVNIVCDVADIIFDHPIVPANMEDVAGPILLSRQVESGGLALMHRFQSVEAQIETFKALGEEPVIGASIGVQWEDQEAAEKLCAAGIGIICVDIAHGDHSLAERMVSFLHRMDSTKRPIIIAGNVATKGGAKRLWEAGADIVKVGVGPGSLCTTRIETGCGVPQLTAIMDVAEVREEYFPCNGIIADGGIKNAGDCVKALCFADMVMVGNLFAGTNESPGARLARLEESTQKRYRGSSTHKTSHVEGVQAWVKASGPFDDVLYRLLEGIRSGCSYQGSENLEQLKEGPELIRITSAGLRESYPHDVHVIPEKG
jgi:IMP dehydrogenase